MLKPATVRYYKNRGYMRICCNIHDEAMAKQIEALSPCPGERAKLNRAALKYYLEHRAKGLTR